MRRLFLGGLAWATTEESLRAAFAPFGPVLEATVARDPLSGRSRGHGFVVLADDESAMRAVGTLDGSELDGRTVQVEFAKQPRQRPGSDRDRSPGRPRH